MDYKDLRELARIAVSADPKAPVAYSFGEEKFTLDQVNEALATEFRALAPDYRTYKENQNTIFRLIEESINEVLPARVEQQYMQFAEVRRVAQGDKAIFRQRITEAAKIRAKKNFVTRVGLAGRYEVFMLDGREIEVQTAAIGGAARIGFEEFLDGRLQFSDLTSLVIEGMDEYIYREIAKALEATVANLPAVQRAEVAGFDEATMDELLAIGDAYGRSAIYCTAEFAAKMLPAAGWVSDNMKDALQEAAETVAGSASVLAEGEPFGVDVHEADYVAIASIYPESQGAAQANFEENVLLKALDGAGLPNTK